jgi:hypothetical protein
MATIEVIAHKKSTARFVVIAGDKEEAQDAIAKKLRSGEGIVWTDDPAGVSVAVIWGNDIWRPRMKVAKTLRLENDPPKAD